MIISIFREVDLDFKPSMTTHCRYKWMYDRHSKQITSFVLTWCSMIIGYHWRRTLPFFSCIKTSYYDSIPNVDLIFACTIAPQENHDLLSVRWQAKLLSLSCLYIVSKPLWAIPAFITYTKQTRRNRVKIKCVFVRLEIKAITRPGDDIHIMYL